MLLAYMDLKFLCDLNCLHHTLGHLEWKNLSIFVISIQTEHKQPESLSSHSQQHLLMSFYIHGCLLIHDLVAHPTSTRNKATM